LNEDQITLITKGLSAVVEKVVNPAEAAQKWLTDKLSTKPTYKEKVLTALEAKLDRSIPIPDQDVRDGRIVREIEDVRLNPDKIYVEKAWVLRKSHIGVELTIEADIDVLLDARRTSAKNGQLYPVNGDSLLERQAIHGYVNGQLEIQDGSDSDKIFDSYAYVARVSDRPTL
jgi:hypothetical protein